jgi:large subunit ribosomal protein L9
MYLRLKQDALNEKLGVAQKRATEIEALSITIATKAGEEGKLFGSITVRDIVEAVAAKSVVIDKGEVKMPSGPIRELGEFEISIQLHPEVTTILKVGVITEE